MTSIIQTSVLRAAVLSAFDRGRYQVQFGTAPAGDDIAVVPASIVLDLAERDDDLLGSEPFELFTDAEVRELWREVAAYQPESIVAGVFGADDHGPAVPVQDGPRVYEFALQGADCRFTTPKALDEVQVGHAPDMNAFHAADWVHVYDRVTRERRTLKRPVEDKIIKGLADVAADLRGGPVKGPFTDKDGGAEVFVPTQPAPGSLTSADGLMRGDVVMCRSRPSRPFIGRVAYVTADSLAVTIVGRDRASFCNVSDCSFVGRPDADGWMDWPGGQNPVGDAVIETKHRDGEVLKAGPASDWESCWQNDGDAADIVRIRLVHLPALPSDT